MQYPQIGTSYEVGGAHDYSGLRTGLSTDQTKVSGKDSISKISPSRLDSIISATQGDGKPHLPPAQSQNYPALQALAAAFAAIFMALESSASTSVEGLQQNQLLNNIQAKVVMIQTNITITKQNQAYKNYEKLQEEANNPLMKILSIVLMVVMVVVIIATVVSGFFDGGASDTALVPEMMAMTELSADAGATGAATATTGEAMADVSATIMETNIDEAMASMEVSGDTTVNAGGTSMEADVSVEEEIGEVGDSVGQAGNLTDTVGDQAAEEGEELTTQGMKTDARAAAADQGQEETGSIKEAAEDAAKKAAKKGLSRGWKLVISLTAGAIGGAPQLVESIQSFKLEAQYKAQASLQRSIGVETSRQSYQEAMFKFLQQAGSRDSQTAVQEVSGGTDAMKTYASIISSYQQAYANSKQAVV